MAEPIYVCPIHGRLFQSEVVHRPMTDYTDLRCSDCGRSVSIYDERLDFEFVCPECGYSCFDPEIELGDDREVVRICPKCGVVEDDKDTDSNRPTALV